MKFAALISATLALATAAVAKQPPFTGMALRSASPIHFQPLVARDGGIWVGGKSQSYCPEVVGDCPKGKTTGFVGGDQTMYMNVAVPGGQQAYIGPTGWLQYTGAHSAFIPRGSKINKFLRKDTQNDYDILGCFGGYTWYACMQNNGGRKVFAPSQAVKNNPKCLSFTFAAPNAKGLAAWQYA